MWKRYRPLVFEIDGDSIEVERSCRYIYVSFEWLCNGEHCGRYFKFFSEAYGLDKDFRAAYKIADDVISLLSKYFARMFSLNDDSNHIGHKTRDLVATKIINLYKGE